MNDSLSIGEVARRTGVPSTALRWYEQIGLLPAPRRVGGKRRYDAQVIETLTVIQVAQRAGFTINEIRSLLYDFDSSTSAATRWHVFAQRKLEQLAARQKEIEAHKQAAQELLTCTCSDLQQCATLFVQSRP